METGGIVQLFFLSPSTYSRYVFWQKKLIFYTVKTYSSDVTCKCME